MKAPVGAVEPRLLDAARAMYAFLKDRRTKIVYPHGRELVDILVEAGAAIKQAEAALSAQPASPAPQEVPSAPDQSGKQEIAGLRDGESE